MYFNIQHYLHTAMPRLCIFFRAGVFFGVSLLVWSAGAQEVVGTRLEKGVEYFYTASFDLAVETLQDAIKMDELNKDELFAAHLYLAFCHLRLNAPEQTIQEHFRTAVRVNPDFEIDPVRTPPDLHQQFYKVRSSLLGKLVLSTIPSGATIFLVDSLGSNMLNQTSPAIFPNLLVGSYEILIAKEGYKALTDAIQIHPGVSDSLVITLEKKGKPFLKKWWPWGGFAVAAVVAVSALTRDDKATLREDKELPFPPPRP